MNKGLILLFVFLSQLVNAQDLLNLLNEEEGKVVTTSLFKDTRIVNAQSTVQTAKGEFKFLIQHRFGTINQGAYSLWGLDDSKVRMGFEYGLTEKIALGLGRSSDQKEYDFSVKYIALQQSNEFPFQLSAYVALFAIHPSENQRTQADFDFLNFLSNSNQLIIARKFSSDLTLAILPTHLHLNIVEAGQKNESFFLGLGGRYKITKRVSINAEYFYAFEELENSTNVLSLGFDIETGGHVFSLHLSNSRGMNERAFLRDTKGEWSEGDIYFGFNISRSFSW